MNAIKYALLGLYGIIGVLISAFGLFRLPYAEQFAKEHYRYAIAAVLAILLIIPIAIVVFILSFNANNFKTEIVQYVKDHSQRDLVLQGDIKVNFFPKLGLDSGKLLLSQRNSAREFASVNDARLYIAWWPLLKRQLVIDHVEIDGARVNLIRYKNGTTNYDDLLIRDEVLSPMTFDIDGLRISNSSVNWQDEIKWQRVSLQDLQVETGRLADGVPGNIKASFRLSSEKAHSDSRINMKSSLFYDRQAGRYEFADLEGTLDGTAAGFSNLDINFKGSLESRPAQVSLSAENVVVSGKGNYGQRSFTARMVIPKLQYARGILNGSEASLDAALSQFDEKWTTTLQVPAFEFAGNKLKAAELVADFDFASAGRTLHGKLSGPINLDFETAPNLQLGAIALDLTAKHPMLAGEQSAKVTGSMSADFSGQNAHLDFKARFNESEIIGKVALKDFSHPAYTADLYINRIQLDRYIASDWINRYQDNAAPIDVAGLKGINVSGSLHAGEIRIAKLDARKLAAGIKIEQSVLTVEPLTARLYGGTMTGRFSLAAQDKPQIAFRQNLKAFQMSAMLADTASAGKLAGKGDLAVDLSAEGGSVGALRKTLNGSVSLSLGRGSLQGIDLRSALIEGTDDLGTGSKPRVHPALFTEKTDFSELKAVFDIKDDTSHGNDFDMRSPQFRIAGEGDLALDTGKIDYQLTATVASKLTRRNAGELAELKAVSVPVRVSGPWAAPSIALDFGAASGGIVTKRLAAKAAEQAAAAKPAAPTKKRAAKKAERPG